MDGDAEGWEDAARRVAALARSDAGAAEHRIALGDDVIAAMVDGGCCSMLVPTERGGGEGRVRDLLDAALIVGAADTSAAWVMVFYALHGWLAALFPPDGQDDLFAGGPTVLAPATFSPTGTARPDRDGAPTAYRVTGRWAWATGVAHARWAMVACLVRSDDGPVTDVRLVAVPMDDVTVEPTWDTSGMRATASHDVVIDDALVPDHRTLSFAALLDGTAAATCGHDAPLYRWPLAPILALGAAAPALGAARGLLDGYVARAGDRRLAYLGTVDASRPSTRARVARSTVELDAAEALVRCGVADIEARLTTGAAFGLEPRARGRMIASHAVAVARGVAHSIAEASGASAQRRTDHLQRAVRDLDTLSGHVVFDDDASAELYGALRLGQDPPPALV